MSGESPEKRSLIPMVEPVTQDIIGRKGEYAIDFLIRVGIINNADKFNPDRTMTR
jgi:hypothetical protein